MKTNGFDLEYVFNQRTHASILQPSLETQFASFRPSNARATLTADPLHQDLLQLRVILAVNFILNLSAHAVGWTFVSHAGTLGLKRGGEVDGNVDSERRNKRHKAEHLHLKLGKVVRNSYETLGL